MVGVKGAADSDPAPDTRPGDPVRNAGNAELTALLAAQRQALEAKLDAIDDKVVLLEQNIVGLRLAADASQREGEGMSADLGSIQGEVRQLREAMATLPSADQLLEDARITPIMAGLAAVCSLIAVIAVVILRPGKSGAGGAVDRRLRELAEAIERLAAAPAKAADPAPKPADPAAADALAGLRAATAELKAMAETLAHERELAGARSEQLEAAGSALAPALDELRRRLAELEAARTMLAAERAETERRSQALVEESKTRAADQVSAQQVRQEMEQRLAEGHQVLARYDFVWPEALKPGAPLAAWRDILLARAAAGKGEAAVLISALIRWNVVCTGANRERDQWVAAADRVGRAAHAFLAGETSNNGEEALERLQQWTRAFKTPLEEAFPNLKLNAVYPGDRFDTDRMEAIGANSSARQTVARPMSWFILEKNTEGTRVLRRAQVVTA